MIKSSIKKIMISVIIATMLLLQSQVFATGGQASGTSNSVYNKTVSYMFELIRTMETSTGTLGKSSNINTTNYVDSSGNGIDCHLEKNTEYGTITILASSEYGNKTSTDTASTGEKNTGVFQMGNMKPEHVANTLQESQDSAKILKNNGALVNADSRYVNEYIGTAQYSIPGDGIQETDGWGGTTRFVTTSLPVFNRGVNGIFGYFFSDGNSVNFNYYGLAARSFNCRAVVVCGSGL